MFFRNKKNNIYPCKPQFYYIKVGFKGIKIIYVCFPDDVDKFENPFLDRTLASLYFEVALEFSACFCDGENGVSPTLQQLYSANRS